MSKTSFKLIGVAVLGIATLVFIWQRQNDAKQDFQPSGLQSEVESLATASMKPSNAMVSSNAKDFTIEASSLRGTEVDGAIVLGANGQVVLDLGMRRLFDYYLSLVGERDVVQIRQLLKDYLLAKHSQANTQKVLLYFDQYGAYLNELAALNIGGLGNPQDRLEKVQALRKKMLGEPMAQAFFADEEALASLTLKRMAIANDASLDGDEKIRLLAELDSSANHSARTEADTAAMVAEQSRQLDSLESSDAEKVAEREATWGRDAAARLAKLDQERAQWDVRVAQYLQARSRIEANRGLSAAARAQAIATLRAQRFNAIEQRRIASLEAIGQLKPGG